MMILTRQQWLADRIRTADHLDPLRLLGQTRRERVKISHKGRAVALPRVGQQAEQMVRTQANHLVALNLLPQATQCNH